MIMSFLTIWLVDWSVNSYECQLSLSSHGDSLKHPHTFSDFYLENFYLLSKSQFRYHFVSETFSDSTYQIELPL